MLVSVIQKKTVLKMLHPITGEDIWLLLFCSSARNASYFSRSVYLTSVRSKKILLGGCFCLLFFMLIVVHGAMQWRSKKFQKGGGIIAPFFSAQFFSAELIATD